MRQSRENLRTDGRMDGRTDGRTDRPYLQDPFGQGRGSKKKKHNEIFMPVRSQKLNSFETLISQALLNSEINHKEFNMIIDEKEK